jgi:crossover junction endodeoxyribonuclease RuvC
MITRVLGLDPGLQHTGWGVVEADGNRLRYIADGTVNTDSKLETAVRLKQLHDGLTAIIQQFSPDAAAVEETFVNKNPVSTLKLGLARGVVLLVPALANLEVSEYPANLVKKSVVGVGHATKEQVQMMVARLLPGSKQHSADSADALAIAICHIHHAATRKMVGGIMAGGAR